MTFDIRSILRRVVELGWRYERRSSGHIAIYPADRSRGIVVISGTPSDHRALYKAMSDLKRAGFVY